MCRCCQNCLESCWWKLIEERFCFDENIANYQDPFVKEEKNNNFCDNMAFYDSVSVIAGRAIVTIDPLPEKRRTSPISVQPRRQVTLAKKSKSQSSINNIPAVVLDLQNDTRCESIENDKIHDIRDEENLSQVKKSVSFGDISNKTLKMDKPNDISAKSETSFLAPPPNVELRKKSLMERRQSRSLHLKIDFPKELPIIRQSSVPKFFLDTPEHNQTESSLIRGLSTALQSPMICKGDLCYDLKSVVQIESEKLNVTDKEQKNVPLVHKNSSVSKLTNIKDKIKLRKSKSSVSTSYVPHTNYI